MRETIRIFYPTAHLVGICFRVCVRVVSRGVSCVSLAGFTSFPAHAAHTRCFGFSRQDCIYMCFRRRYQDSFVVGLGRVKTFVAVGAPKSGTFSDGFNLLPLLG